MSKDRALLLDILALASGSHEGGFRLDSGGFRYRPGFLSRLGLAGEGCWRAG